MELRDKYFVAIYTNEVKDYAAKEFFDPLKNFTIGGVVDNSTNPSYYNKLKGLTSLPVHHLAISYEPRETLFQRNVAESVSFLREIFLSTPCEYFLILESDVIIPENFIELIDREVQKMPEDWGALGCLYYNGFHDYSKTGINPTNHVLSGATVYRRKAIKEIPFRWSSDNLAAFPDAWWSIDALKSYSLWNTHDIRLPHKHAENGTRYSKDL